MGRAVYASMDALENLLSGSSGRNYCLNETLIMIKLWSAFISRQYRNCTEHQQDGLNCINLVKPEFFIPTAEASHLVDWDKIFAEHWVRELPLDLSQPLLNLIDKQIDQIPKFDFKMIQSLTNSKGFGSYSYTINGSWFRDIGSWGARNVSFRYHGGMHYLDWKRNIKHVESEAFRLESPVYFEYLDWLNRYVAFQAGYTRCSSNESSKSRIHTRG